MVAPVSPFTVWRRLCEEALCSPDTLMTEAEFVERYEKHTGQWLSVETVTRLRKEAWDWIHSQPSVGGFTVQL